MSELKADNTFVFGEECLAYKKSEADKVISEKDKEIAELKGDITDLRDDKKLTDAILDERNAEIAELKKERDWLAKDRAQAYDDLEKRAQLNIKQEESIRHHKYKRCLDKAKWCKDEMQHYKYNDGVFLYGFRFYEKWYKRWLKLVAKFKEAK